MNPTPAVTRGSRALTRAPRRTRWLLGGGIVLLVAAGIVLAFMPAPTRPVPAVGDIGAALGKRPQYAFAFPEKGTTPLERPVSVVAVSGRVYVVDSQAKVVRVFDERGAERSVIGSGTLGIPVYAARDDARGILYVTDREHKAVFKFDDTDGTPLGTLVPKPSKDDTRSAESTAWAPLGIDVAEDGTVWVSDVLARHRVLEVQPDGTVVREVGGARAAAESTGVAVMLDYPTGVAVGKDEIWVSDSNNRRIVVFGRDGSFRRVLDVDALARGMAFLPASAETSELVVVADALAQDIEVWDEAGTVLGRFGGPGSAAGQLSFPNDIAADPAGERLYVADTGNKRIQVWTWVDAEKAPAGGTAGGSDASRRVPYIVVATILVLLGCGLVAAAFWRPRVRG